MIFKPVKSDGIHEETFLEHAMRTYKIGEFLYNNLSVEVDRNKYLYSCFFHDVGKLEIEKLGQPHSGKTEEALIKLKDTKYYGALLKNFELPDFSTDEGVINAITKHHDSDTELGLLTALADHITSSKSNEELKDRLKTSTVLTFFNELEALGDWNIYHIRIPSFSKNELNAVGKLLLLKLLYETMDELETVKLLYETLDGCRIATRLDRNTLKGQISAHFNNLFAKFVGNQDLLEFIGGAPDAYKQYATFPVEAKEKLLELIADKYINDVLRDLKKEKIESIDEIGMSRDEFIKFANLDELLEYTYNISKTKYTLLAGEDKKYQPWIAETFELKKVEDKLNPNSTPLLERYLRQVGVDVDNLTHKDVLYSKLFSMVVGINSLKKSEVKFSFDISEYMVIDNDFSMDKLAKDNVCSNCGTFEGVIPLPTFTLESRQHFRESLFRAKNADIRKGMGKIMVCEICHAETLLNALLCGTTFQASHRRINPKTHLIIYGLDIDRDILENFADEEFVESLKKQYKITHKSIYAKDKKDIQIAFYSLAEYNVGIKNETYKELLFSSLCNRIRKYLPLPLSFSVNRLPSKLTNDIIQMQNKDIKYYPQILEDYFIYVFTNVWGNYEEKRDYILKYYNQPFIGISQIFKRRKSKYNEKTHRMVEKLSENDKLYEITDAIWEMAKIGGALETGRNVGSYMGVFKGRPEDLDKVCNRILKNEKLSKEKRSEILQIYKELRSSIKGLSDDERRELKDYIQKTKYLFNSKKFYEISKKEE